MQPNEAREIALREYKNNEQTIRELRNEFTNTPGFASDEGEVSTFEQMRAVNTARINNLTARQFDIKATLKRIAEDEFGWCEKCGAEIEAERLETVFTAENCSTCSDLQYHKDRHFAQ